ncbi:MAG: efflux RND transporter periplasmic adaptor subunit [gamma proteobacterium symbiont of Bathyaustriella thionipta]|nr:efflux RND transporter periplasmic adaptor subunit [gamma proteobacterium symbiont of Bathyaustriella thionipta]MCU7951229.1 efflux RND transporter periplasmic adaptor subunit [gamma proteobacterium symbiont of Bathyaustriella thionipta]MCU7951922.1 efflux RND transporter periplasmic adaptor subunit [gamma proteobacterium symbiont of Bathyaustriella thionipta]MCU7957757.1 efflux RND transporter periplasmic adaptor subunit [gamma proteobacterium symbiont of Bathyaustriella thionipta]MCU796837
MQRLKNPIKKQLTSLANMILFLFITGFISGCDDKAPVKKRSPNTLAAVEVTQAKIQSLNHTITLTGTLKPKRTIHFYNQAQGMLVELPFHEGDKVNKGDLLAQLDDTIIKAEYNKANATLKQAHIDYGRLEKLAKTNLTSRELLVRAKTKVALDQSEYNLQKKRLSYTQVKVPWDGVISERLVEPGDVLPLHTHFMSLMDISSLIVNISLSELHLSKIKQNDTITYQIDALGKKSWSGTVLRIYPQINAQTRKGIVEVKLDPIPQGARPGQLARISLVTKKEAVLVIPLSAIRYDQQGAYVFVVDIDHKITRTNILTGRKYPQKMEVLDGIKAGDVIVSKGLFGLRSGKKVSIIK